MTQLPETEIRVGQTVELSLPEMWGAGYFWDDNAIRNSSVASVREIASPHVGNTPSEEMIIGGPRMRRLSVLGERVGEFRMTHSRPWLGPQEGDDALTVRVLPRAEGPLFHDFHRGMDFSFNGMRWFCEAVVDDRVLAVRVTDGTLRFLEADEMSSVLLFPHKASPLGWKKGSPRPPLRAGSLWRHCNGGLYVIVAEGFLKANALPAVTYRSVADGSTWTCSRLQFLDASEDMPRFLCLAA